MHYSSYLFIYALCFKCIIAYIFSYMHYILCCVLCDTMNISMLAIRTFVRHHGHSTFATAVGKGNHKANVQDQQGQCSSVKGPSLSVRTCLAPVMSWCTRRTSLLARLVRSPPRFRPSTSLTRSRSVIHRSVSCAVDAPPAVFLFSSGRCARKPAVRGWKSLTH